MLFEDRFLFVFFVFWFCLFLLLFTEVNNSECIYTQTTFSFMQNQFYIKPYFICVNKSNMILKQYTQSLRKTLDCCTNVII